MLQSADPDALEKERKTIGAGTVLATRWNTMTVVFYSLISWAPEKHHRFILTIREMSWDRNIFHMDKSLFWKWNSLNMLRFLSACHKLSTCTHSSHFNRNTYSIPLLIHSIVLKTKNIQVSSTSTSRSNLFMRSQGRTARLDWDALKKSLSNSNNHNHGEQKSIKLSTTHIKYWGGWATTAGDHIRFQESETRVGTDSP